MKMRPISIVFAFAIFFCAISDLYPQTARKTFPSNQIRNPQAAVAKLRELYQKRDFERGFELGEKLVRQFPDNAELQAWFIVNMARNEMSKQAVEAAKKLVDKQPENAWAQFALAHAYIRDSQSKEAVYVVEKALKLKPDDEEFIFLYASALLAQKKYDEIYALLDKNSARIKDQSRLLSVRAEAQYRQATADCKVDEAKRKLSFETFAKARELSPNSVNANYIYGLYLNSANALPKLCRF